MDVVERQQVKPKKKPPPDRPPPQDDVPFTKDYDESQRKKKGR
jgi:hypothetical protein